MSDPEIPPRMSRIERLMADLEAAATGPGARFPGSVEQMAGDARQLILDLLGMSDKPVGERIYTAMCAKMAAEHGTEGAGDLPTMIRFAKRWLPECFPATDAGQVPFARALVESLVAAAEAHLAKPAETQAVRDVLAERRRQIEVEGWTPEHDDTQHDPGELAAAGAAYALNAGDQLHPISQGDGDNQLPSWWPFDASWWKPGDPRRDLVKAGALILAEIERQDREAAHG